MKFLMIVKSSERSEAGQLPDERMLTEMGRFNGEIIGAGVMLGGEGLHASAKGSRVRRVGGKTSVVDGPFAESKELVGGFWLIEAPSLAEAVVWAKKAPGLDGEIELRPLYDATDFGATEPSDPPPPAPRQPGTRRWMLIGKATAATEAGPPSDPKVFEAMDVLMGDLIKQGALLGGEGLKPSRQSARVRRDGAQRTVIDGPFTESKELIAGYMILQTRTKEDAEGWARRWVEVHAGDDDGEIEVRLLAELDDFTVDPGEKPDGWRAQEKAFRERT